MVVVHLTAGCPCKPLRYDLRVEAARYKDDHGATLTRSRTILPRGGNCFLDVRQPFCQRLVEFPAIVEHVADPTRGYRNVRPEGVCEEFLGLDRNGRGDPEPPDSSDMISCSRALSDAVIVAESSRNGVGSEASIRRHMRNKRSSAWR